MQTKTFSISINAPKEKVWQALWNDDTYKQWTRVFAEGSYAVSDWQQGSKIQFLTPSGQGMYSIIDRLVPSEVMSFKHQGEIKEGVEQPPKEAWAGASETYTLTQQNSHTLLTVTLEMLESDAAYFDTIFPTALQKVAEIAEA